MTADSETISLLIADIANFVNRALEFVVERVVERDYIKI